MRKAAAVILTIVFFAAMGRAQNVKFSVGPQAGIAIEAFESPWSDYFGAGFGGGAHADVDIIKFFSVRLSVDYYTFASDKDKLKTLIADYYGILPSDISSLSGGNVGAFNVSMQAIGKIPTPSSVTPYALFGIGIHSLTLSDLNGTSPTYGSGTITSDQVNFDGGTKFGLDFGFGIEYAASRQVSLMAEFRYVLVFTKIQNNGAMPITIGANFHL